MKGVYIIAYRCPLRWLRVLGCECGAGVIPCTVLDPFSGAGTTGVVCAALGRRYVGIELSPAYVEMSAARLDKTTEAP